MADGELSPLFAATDDPLVVVDADFTIRDANAAAGRAAGCSPAELRGRRCWEVLHGVDRIPESCPLPAALVGRTTKEASVADGAGRTWRVVCRAITDEAGWPVAAVERLRRVEAAAAPPGGELDVLRDGPGPGDAPPSRAP